ncbi:MAG TPA: hypothetical protein VLH35_04840, partial [Candidatus Acidoferrales bacterium]|nr:hypothetical protein [Candidatus Acidoferrales bacterium]
CILGHVHWEPSDAVKIGAGNVKISDLTISSAGSISGNGDGIELVSNIINITMSARLTGNKLTVARNTINANDWSVTGSDLTLAQNTISPRGKEVHSNGNSCNITTNAINGTLWLTGSSNRIIGNSYEALFCPQGDSNVISYNSGPISLGNSAHSCSNNIISGNLIKGPSVWGIWIGAHCNSNLFIDNYIADEGYDPIGDAFNTAINFGGDKSIGTNNTFYHNAFVNNQANVKFNNGMVISGNNWNNTIQGNYWSDYNDSDADGDGLGDTPYIINSANSDGHPLIAQPFDMPTINVPPPVYNPPITISDAMLTQPSTPTPTINPKQSATNNKPATQSTTPNSPSSPQTIPEYATVTILLLALTIAVVAVVIALRLKKPIPENGLHQTAS